MARPGKLLRVVIAFILALLTLAASCSAQRGKTEMNPSVLRIFTDFTLVGVGPVASDTDALDRIEIVAHDENELPNPKMAQGRTQYVYHYRGSLNPESLALHQLPERLSKSSLRIMKAPKSSSDLLYLVVGGPLFYIEFSDGVNRGVIFNRLHLDLGEPWDTHDYVLIYPV